MTRRPIRAGRIALATALAATFFTAACGGKSPTAPTAAALPIPVAAAPAPSAGAPPPHPSPPVRRRSPGT